MVLCGTASNQTRHTKAEFRTTPDKEELQRWSLGQVFQSSRACGEIFGNARRITDILLPLDRFSRAISESCADIL
jgi:hypothetical protein